MLNTFLHGCIFSVQDGLLRNWRVTFSVWNVLVPNLTLEAATRALQSFYDQWDDGPYIFWTCPAVGTCPVTSNPQAFWTTRLLGFAMRLKTGKRTTMPTPHILRRLPNLSHGPIIRRIVWLVSGPNGMKRCTNWVRDKRPASWEFNKLSELGNSASSWQEGPQNTCFGGLLGTIREVRRIRD